MQQFPSIHNATVNAFARFVSGQAVVVANAAAGTSARHPHAVTKCSDPGLTTIRPRGRGWREGSLSLGSMSKPGSGYGVTEPGRGYPRPTAPAMPPALWASWILSRSLCG